MIVRTESRFYNGRIPNAAERIERDLDDLREAWQATDPDNDGLDVLAYVYEWNAEETDILDSGFFDEYEFRESEVTYEVEYKYLDSV